METNPLNRRIRILALGDAPTVKTGFGRVNRELFGRLDPEKYDVTWVGVNYHATPLDVMQRWHQPIISANPANTQEDVHGRQLAADLLQHAATIGEPFDLFWMHNDIPVAHGFTKSLKDGLKEVCGLAGVVIYSPLDSELQTAAKWLEITTLADVYGTYTWWSKLEIEKYSPANMKVFYIGQDPKWCSPLEDPDSVQKFRAQVMGIEDPETFVVSSINRNQERKDLPRLMKAFAHFHEQVPNSVLYLHVDPTEWIDLNTVAFKLGIDKCAKFLGTKQAQVVGDDFMQLVYASSHAVATLSRGEGWGLSVTEAMGMKVPVLVAYNTAAHDLLGEVQDEEAMLAERGIAIPAGADDSMWIVGQDVMLRPLADLKRTVDALLYVHGEYEDLKTFTLRDKHLKTTVERAHQWVRSQLNWDKIVRQWDKVFTELVAAKAAGMTLPEPIRQGAVPAAKEGTIK